MFTLRIPTRNLSLSPPSVTVSAGNTANYTVTITDGGNNNTCTLTLSLAYTGIPPVGTTPTFTPNPLIMTSGERKLGLDHHDDEYWYTGRANSAGYL